MSANTTPLTMVPVMLSSGFISSPPQEIRVKANATRENQRILPGFEGKATDIKRGTAPSRRSNSALLEALPNAVSAARLVDLIEPPMVRVEFLDTGRNDR